MRLKDTTKNNEGKFFTPSDQTVPELQQTAKKALAMFGPTVPSAFVGKFTCENCGERNFCAQPNVFPKTVECETCGNSQPFTRGGFALRHTFNADATGEPATLVRIPEDYSAQPNEAQNALLRAFGMATLQPQN